ncbi:MAG TPA: hypothetical protein VNL13_00830 [Sulfolobales archaeon]|nr:hypothetical protein [Sulfolobales archaeon]
MGLKEISYGELIPLAVILIAMSMLPMIGLSSYMLTILSLLLLFGALVSIYDFFYIRSGYINLGYTYIVASSAFSIAIALERLPTALAILVAFPLSMFFSIAILVPMLKLRGPFYSVATLLYPFTLAPIARLFPEVFGGDVGVYVRPLLSSPTLLYYLSLAVSVGVLSILFTLLGTRLSIKLAMIRDDEILAESSGIGVIRVKILSHIMCTLMVTAVMIPYTQVSGVASVELADPIPVLIYALMASALYKPGSALYSFLGGMGIWWLDNYMRAAMYDLRLVVASSLLLTIYAARVVLGFAGAKIRK